MAEGRFVAYFRVSTARQGKSGLGLEAQRDAVATYLNGGAWSQVADFTEVESGKHSDRPELTKAMQACRLYGAKLIIAKLDRLSRDAHFLLGLEKAGVDFVAADMPTANRLTVGIMAMVAEEERRMISARTKAALAEAKRRGVKLGGAREKHGLTNKVRAKARAAVQERVQARAADLAGIVKAAQAATSGSLRAIAAKLNEDHIPAPRGGTWNATQVSRLLDQLGE